MSQPNAAYSPPPGPPPGHLNLNDHAPVYAPPPGSPPREQNLLSGMTSGTASGSGTTALQPASNTSSTSTNPPDSEPPPPYTAKASDPLPSWAESTAQLEDISTITSSLPLIHLPLDPPPNFFSTPSPPRIRTRSFAPFTLPSRSSSLADGFAPLYHSALRAHGVPPEAWARFLRDVQRAAQLAREGRGLGGAPPRVTGLAVGRVRGRAYDAAFVKSPVEQVQGLVEVYNESAWVRRKVRVTVRMTVGEGGKEGYNLLVEAL